jgi:hypothetical protein
VGALDVEVIPTDQFIVTQWDLDHLVALAAFKRMRARWKKPEATAEHFAEAMEPGGLPATAQSLREAGLGRSEEPRQVQGRSHVTATPELSGKLATIASKRRVSFCSRAHQTELRRPRGDRSIQGGTCRRTSR